MLFKNIIKNKKGFTLIELLLVVAILGISMGVTTDILLSVTKNYSKTQILNEIEQQANFVALKITKELRNATDLTLPTLGSADGNSLQFLARDGNEVKYYLDNGTLFRQDIIGGNTSPALPITSSVGNEGISVSCTTKCFTLMAENPDILGISLIFNKANLSLLSTLNTNIKIEDTIVIRGSY
jgi:prepilin-type N-terminal cleavage/methylation domain-containing protein